MHGVALKKVISMKIGNDAQDTAARELASGHRLILGHIE